MEKVLHWALLLSVLACQTLLAAGTLTITAYINRNSHQVVKVELRDSLVEEITYAGDGTKVNCIVYSAFKQRVNEQAIQRGYTNLGYTEAEFIAITQIGSVQLGQGYHVKLGRLFQIDSGTTKNQIPVQAGSTDQNSNNTKQDKRPSVVIRANPENRWGLVTYPYSSDTKRISELSDEEYTGYTLGPDQVRIQDPVVYLVIPVW